MSFVALFALVAVGVILVFLGIMAGGNVAIIGLGVAAVFGAGVLAVIGDRSRRAE
jgi:hypothetical protein